jgi:hypothetical protein
MRARAASRTVRLVRLARCTCLYGSDASLDHERKLSGRSAGIVLRSIDSQGRRVLVSVVIGAIVEVPRLLVWVPGEDWELRPVGSCVVYMRQTSVSRRSCWFLNLKMKWNAQYSMSIHRTLLCTPQYKLSTTSKYRILEANRNIDQNRINIVLRSPR